MKPMMLFETALGTCGVEWSDAGLTGVALPGEKRARTGAAGEPPAYVRAAVEEIHALLAGEARDLRDVVIDDSAVGDFDRAVYAATRLVGPGETATYGEIARAMGASGPDAARAVGGALGRNRWPIVVPCHRVLAADGALRGFSAPGGIATKRRMLEIEGAVGFRQQALFA